MFRRDDSIMRRSGKENSPRPDAVAGERLDFFDFIIFGGFF
jgi:hypothetical protein